MHGTLWRRCCNIATQDDPAFSFTFTFTSAAAAAAAAAAVAAMLVEEGNTRMKSHKLSPAISTLLLLLLLSLRFLFFCLCLIVWWRTYRYNLDALVPVTVCNTHWNVIVVVTANKWHVIQMKWIHVGVAGRSTRAASNNKTLPHVYMESEWKVHHVIPKKYWTESRRYLKTEVSKVHQNEK